MLKRIIRKFLGYPIHPLPTPQSVSEPEPFNWDDCNPRTNGENFFLRTYARHWAVCIDVGANEGVYAKSVLDLNPACRVICFEPNRALESQLAAKGLQEIHFAAVSNQDGSLMIHLNTEDSTQSSQYRLGAHTTSTEVPALTLDRFAEDHGLKQIDFVKIDTEGNELYVLQGAAGLCSRRMIDMIQFEYGGTYADAGTTLREIFDLIGKDYLICHLMPTGLLPVRYQPKLETFRYSNWVAVSRSYATLTLVGRDDVHA